MGSPTPPSLQRSAPRGLSLQRFTAQLFSPLSIYAVVAFLSGWLRLRVVGARELRRRYREISRPGEGPLLICANHLTLIDSALIAWALAPPGWYVRHFRTLPWNVPERNNFASTPLQRILAYIYKCLPIVRGGNRSEVADTLGRLTQLVARGEVGLLFPEGGRSRSGRVEPERAAWGVGRVVKAVPGCRVLCVYLRGERQQGYSALPFRRDRLHTRLSLIEPKTHYPGLRGSRELARQIADRLAEMEREHFDART